MKMTPEKFRAIRRKAGLSRVELARCLGYDGEPETVRQQIAKFETGRRPISPWIIRLMMMFDCHGIPEKFFKADAFKNHHRPPS
jgi:transcriptional regulator with XRE-family HTH domain